MNKRLVLFFAAIGQAFRLLILPASLPGASPAQRSENHWADGTVAVSLIPMFIEMQKIGAVSNLGQDARLDGVGGRVAIRMKIPVGDVVEVAGGRRHSDKVLVAIEDESRKTLAKIKAFYAARSANPSWNAAASKKTGAK
jgi:hypothetical protein